MHIYLCVCVCVCVCVSLCGAVCVSVCVCFKDYAFVIYVQSYSFFKYIFVAPKHNFVIIST